MKPISQATLRQFLYVIFVSFLAVITACTSKDTSVEDGDRKRQLPVDAISSATPSATPGGFSLDLTAAHNGWGQPNCLSTGFHPVNHAAKYKESNCIACHGFNGSPNIPDDHNLSRDTGDHANCSSANCA